jgi:hypothetical protein
LKRDYGIPNQGPPEGFIDNTVYRYRLKPDGTKEFIGTMPPFPEGWDDPAKRKMTPGSGRRDKEEDEDMGRPRREPPPVETLRALYEKYDAKIQPIAIELDATWMMACRWLREAGIIKQKQTPTPEPAAAANQEPERESREPAEPSVSQLENEVKETYEDLAKQEREQQGFGPEDEEPIPYQVVGKYEALGKAIGALVDEKNLQYGDAFNRGGCILEILYPDGVRPDQYRDMLGVIRVIDKLFRVANGKQGSEDPWQDIAGYGLLGTGE